MVFLNMHYVTAIVRRYTVFYIFQLKVSCALEKVNTMKTWLWRTTNNTENVAQTIMRTFGNLIQWFIILLLLFGAFIAIFYWLDTQKTSPKKIKLSVEFSNRPDNPSWMYEKTVEDGMTTLQLIEEISKRNLTVKPNYESGQQLCPNVAPLKVHIKNNSNKVMNSLKFEITARKPKRSSDILKYDDKYFNLDYIVMPGESIERCLPVSAEFSNNLEWSIEGVSASWQ